MQERKKVFTPNRNTPFPRLKRAPSPTFLLATASSFPAHTHDSATLGRESSRIRHLRVFLSCIPIRIAVRCGENSLVTPPTLRRQHGGVVRGQLIPRPSFSRPLGNSFVVCSENFKKIKRTGGANVMM